MFSLIKINKEMQVKKSKIRHNRSGSMQIPESSSETLQELYTNEYNDFFPNILKYSKEEFLELVFERIIIEAKRKYNGFLPVSLTKPKVDSFICENFYLRDIKTSKFIYNSILKKIQKNPKANLFNGKIISHCCDSDSERIVHTCGEKFYYYIFQRSNASTGQLIKELYLLCPDCNEIYNENFVKCFCEECEVDFYTKVLTDKDEEDFPFATWKKYHCNVIINEKMKCIQCQNYLYYDKLNDKLICRKCRIEYNPQSILWTCIICRKEFTSEAKVYNPLEFKNMKMSVKEALQAKIKARPESLSCGCEFNSKTKFFHKLKCSGELFIGEMNKQKILVCSKCHAINYYDTFQWTCPICEEKEPLHSPKKHNAINSRNIKINYDPKHINCRSQEKKNVVKKLIKEIDNSPKGLSTAKKYSFIIPNRDPEKLQKRGCNRAVECRSPLRMLKMNLAKKFSDEEFHHNVRNISNAFAIVHDENSSPNLKERDPSQREPIQKEKNYLSKNNEKSFSTGNNTTYSSVDENQSKIDKLCPLTKEDFEKALANFKARTDFSVDNYLPKKQIGEGTFGKVKVARHMLTNEEVAIKILEKSWSYNNEINHAHSKAISDMEKIMPAEDFFRCHRSYIVNLDKIEYENGFIKKAIRKGYYNGIDGILMERKKTFQKKSLFTNLQFHKV